MKKCKWFFDKKLANVLMIDDLNYGYMNICGNGLEPKCDWGYGCQKKNSIYKYFEDYLLNKYPEIKFTVFLPTGRHSIGLVDTQYPKYTGEFFESESFLNLLSYILANQNEIAYHGHHHGSVSPNLNSLEWGNEFTQLNEVDCLKRIGSDLKTVKQYLGIDLLGGKFPAYRYNEAAKRSINQFFKWWSLDFKYLANSYQYNNGMLYFPTNFSPSGFRLKQSNIIDYLRKIKQRFDLRRFLAQGEVFSIQEHFLSTLPTGKRQTPNIYDDINLLDEIFGILREFDVWYATCSDIAHYIDSYDHTDITQTEDGSWKIKYNGIWDVPFLTVKSRNQYLKEIKTDQIIRGAYKQGEWIFNDIGQGEYQEL